MDTLDIDRFVCEQFTARGYPRAEDEQPLFGFADLPERMLARMPDGNVMFYDTLTEAWLAQVEPDAAQRQRPDSFAYALGEYLIARGWRRERAWFYPPAHGTLPDCGEGKGGRRRLVHALRHERDMQLCSAWERRVQAAPACSPPGQ